MRMRGTLVDAGRRRGIWAAEQSWRAGCLQPSDSSRREKEKYKARVKKHWNRRQSPLIRANNRAGEVGGFDQLVVQKSLHKRIGTRERQSINVKQSARKKHLYGKLASKGIELVKTASF